MRVKVKLCGLTSVEDALMAAEMGVDALGFIFARSPRRVTPETARRIIRMLPPFVKSVGVFVDEDARMVERIAAFCGLDMVQLHGGESPGVCRRLMPRCIKAFQLKGGGSLDGVEDYRDKVRAVLLDAWSPCKRGGTGKVFDWTMIEGQRLPGPLLLAGGLGPQNVREAILAVRPYGVDINSGVELRPGKKDPVKLEALMRRVGNLARCMES